MGLIRECGWCHRRFVSNYNRQKYCSVNCRLKNQLYIRKSGLARKKDNQLCWRCQRACGGCSWSKELKPVKGWLAEVTTIKDNGVSEYNSYRIIDCPMFLTDVY